MNHLKIEAQLKRLADSQSQLSDLLTLVTESQDWCPEPEEWSFRFVAAHLATAERECFQDRIHLITAGDNPSFEYYSNTDWDFSCLDLQTSLKSWRETRQSIFEFVRGLPKDTWSLTGFHKINGPITVWDVLDSMREHDQEHIIELQKMMIKFRNEEGHRHGQTR